MKTIFAILFMFIAVNLSYSDQLAWITKEQAEKTVSYFEENEISQVILWCACCDNDSKLLVNVSKIYFKPASDPKYYEIFIEGVTFNGGGFRDAVDLAYVHIQKGSKWKSLGLVLGFECDPCTKPFKF